MNIVENRRNSRNLKQVRAFNTKEKIIDTAYKLFCQKGYYKTTSIEISKTAGVSIGCFYSYFKDKDAVFFEILNLYSKDFLEIINEISDMLDLYKKDKEEWLLFLMNKLIEIHEKSRDLNKELSALYNSNSTVASVIDEQRNKVKQFIKDFLTKYKDDINVTDLDAAAIIMYDVINSIVDRIVFEKKEISSDRILKAGIEAINKYLYK